MGQVAVLHLAFLGLENDQNFLWQSITIWDLRKNKKN